MCCVSWFKDGGSQSPFDHIVILIVFNYKFDQNKCGIITAAVFESCSVIIYSSNAVITISKWCINYKTLDFYITLLRGRGSIWRAEKVNMVKEVLGFRPWSTNIFSRVFCCMIDGIGDSWQQHQTQCLINRSNNASLSKKSLDEVRDLNYRRGKKLFMKGVWVKNVVLWYFMVLNEQ